MALFSVCSQLWETKNGFICPLFSVCSQLWELFHKGTECHHGIWGVLRREKQHDEYLLFTSGELALDPAGAAGEETGAHPHQSILAYNYRLSRRKKVALRAALPPAPELRFW